ncbi:hypothetical protein Cco03nite_17930 [Catellatospora coxensis]|uniref:Uncharacterized protein n=1 Tax=Catellatospora coxensis TaxID=310354 RepID=A0A8J3KM63_9ACTN|nr:hypothetical protein Cco03nite_17930 [Catellatospora coxensis]
MLTYKLVRAFANLLVSIDLSDEDAIPSEVGSELLGDTAGLLGDLTAEESAELIALIEQVAALETDPERREALAELPETMGLIEE